MKIISINDLDNMEKIEKLCKDSKEPIFVKQDNDNKFVIFDFNYYNDLIYKLNEAKLVNEGLEDLRRGKVIDSNVLKKKL